MRFCLREGGGGDRERETETDRQQTDRQQTTDRQTGRQTTDRQTGRQEGRQPAREFYALSKEPTWCIRKKTKI